jgi:hypothetical protein
VKNIEKLSKYNTLCFLNNIISNINRYKIIMGYQPLVLDLLAHDFGDDQTSRKIYLFNEFTSGLHIKTPN